MKRMVASVMALAFVPVAALAANASNSRTYAGKNADEVYDAARAAITASGWTLKDESKKDGVLVAKAPVATVSINVNELKTGVKVIASASTEVSTARFFENLDQKLDRE